MAVRPAADTPLSAPNGADAAVPPFQLRTAVAPLHEPQCNIVAFRYVPAELRAAPPEAVDLFQLRLRRAVIESGEFYLVQSRIDGRPVLRTTMMNPLTTVSDLRGLLECLRRFGRTVQS